MSPDPYLISDSVGKKVPGRRNISETSLDFSLLNSAKKQQNTFDLAFEAGLPAEFDKVAIISSDGMSTIGRQDDLN